jgi:Carbohydrate-binding module 48 (Isoamylase N-terminal domain)
MNDTCRRVDAAVREWESGSTPDTGNLFLIINHSRACPRCGGHYGPLIPLIRRDAGEHSGLAPYDTPPSGDFTASVMRRMKRTKVRHFSGATMQTVRWALPLAGCVALVLGVGSFILQAHARAAASVVMVSFTLEAPSASRVSLVGDFNQWSPGELNLKAGQKGVWQITVPLRKGVVYTYDFLIDGQQWVADPHSEIQIDDGFGGLSSVLRL